MSTHTEPSTESLGAERRVQVWDPFVRVFHWGVVIAFFVAYFSDDDLLTVHVWAGYTLGALVLLRIAWGFIGPRHARFSDFLTGPWRALRYLLDLLAGRARRHLGHSPAGGVMVLLLLAGMLGTVWSGLELHAVENNAGPLASVTTSSDTAASGWPALIAMARADSDDHEERGERSGRANGDDESFWEEVHELLANGVVALVALHVIGVIVASLAHRENLVGSMFTGTKRAE